MMMILVLPILLLTSCVNQTTDATRIEMSAREPKPAIRERIVPGTTFGNVTLQAKTIEAVRQTHFVNINHDHCSPSRTNISDTWAPEEPKPSEFNVAFLKWKELWIFDACGESIEYEIIYMLHITGHINISVSRLQHGEFLTLH